MAVYKLHIEAVGLTDLEGGVIELARRFQAGSPPDLGGFEERVPETAAQPARRRRAAQRGGGDVQAAGDAAVPPAAPADAAGDDAAVQEPAEAEPATGAVAGAEQPAADPVEPDEAEALAQEGEAAGAPEAEAPEAPQEVSIEDLKVAAKALAGTPGKGVKALQEVFIANGVKQPNDVPVEKRAALLAALRAAAEQ